MQGCLSMDLSRKTVADEIGDGNCEDEDEDEDSDGDGDGPCSAILPGDAGSPED